MPLRHWISNAQDHKTVRALKAIYINYWFPLFVRILPSENAYNLIICTHQWKPLWCNCDWEGELRSGEESKQRSYYNLPARISTRTLFLCFHNSLFGIKNSFVDGAGFICWLSGRYVFFITFPQFHHRSNVQYFYL